MAENMTELFYFEAQFEGCKQTGKNHAFAQHLSAVPLLTAKQGRIAELPPKTRNIQINENLWKSLFFNQSQPWHYHLQTSPNATVFFASPQQAQHGQKICEPVGSCSSSPVRQTGLCCSTKQVWELDKQSWIGRDVQEQSLKHVDKDYLAASTSPVV